MNVPQRNIELTNDNLARSKDRFSAGVTDSVEVVVGSPVTLLVTRSGAARVE